MSERKNASSRKWILSVVTCTALLMALAFLEIERVGRGELFVFSFPWDRAPSQSELNDAKRSARESLLPALLSLAMVGLITGYAFPKRRRSTQTLPRFWRLPLLLFALAVLADLGTTLWFFHVRGVDHELHPGIRLVSYAYGRTVGPVLGKLVQAVGILMLSSLFARHGGTLMISVTPLYFIAAIYNFSLM